MQDELKAKLKTLDDLMWDRRVSWTDIEQWLSNFAPTPDNGPSERLHALYLLSNFSYFNNEAMRALLRALYRDLVQQPAVERIRHRTRGSLDIGIIRERYEQALEGVRFIGVGNPSESGTHLLYYFRQENGLPTKLFVHPHELIAGTDTRPRLATGIKHVVFLDDFCGSGRQVKRYSKNVLQRVRSLSKRVRLSYFPLFATEKGLERVRAANLFNEVSTICELDTTFQALAAASRYFREPHAGIDREFAESMCKRVGAQLNPSAPLGYGGCQLLLGFAHNVPNNTLPIFWANGRAAFPWHPIFRRHTKAPGW